MPFAASAMDGILIHPPTCNTHNVLRNLTIGIYACGVTFSYKSADFGPPLIAPYGVPAVQECCARVNAPLMRIPGNSGCEMQYCEVPQTSSVDVHTVVGLSLTQTATDATVTLTTTYTSTGTTYGPVPTVTNCLWSVYERDVPGAIAEKLNYVGPWCIVRMYDDEITGDQELEAERASQAPESWSTLTDSPYASRTNNNAARTSQGQAGRIKTGGSLGTVMGGLKSGDLGSWSCIAVVLASLMIGL